MRQSVADRLPFNVASYTRSLVHEFDRKGSAQRTVASRADARLWQSRMHNAARRAGFVVTTRVLPVRDRQHWRVVGVVVDYVEDPTR